MPSRQSSAERVAVTMTADAAERFYQALSWATAAASNRADEWEDKGDEERARLFRDHADWLRWGMSRVTQAVPDVIDG
jgi:hypothetical protein